MNRAIPEDRRVFRIALAGNPNSGKTTIFNALTGARQHVGNYPGVTVEKKEGEARFRDLRFQVTDLPGTYSLTARSTEEVVARNVLIEDRPDVVVCIVDASNLERNLYLAVQLMELNVPLVLALNMSDVARDRGLAIDAAELERLLGVPAVATEGHKGRGLTDLLEAVARVCLQDPAERSPARQVDYGHEVEEHVEALAGRLSALPACVDRARWYALKLLEGDPVTERRVRSLCPGESEAVFREAVRLRDHIEKISGLEIGTVLADGRYGFIAGACAEAVSRTAEDRISRSERIDRVLLNRWLGLPFFGLLMYAVFWFTFALGEPLMQGLETGFEALGHWVSALWPAGSDSPLRSLLADGLIGGVGGVLVFLPNILLLFLAISFLEDSGYMARAAFLMDRLMHKIGLHGKSFIPMLTGFGCSIPGIMATRTLESRHDRLTTMLVLPLMSCGARLPIYALIIPAFFPEAWRAPMLWLIYVIGILLAILCAKLLRATFFRGESVPFVMELPPYRLPTLKGILIHMGERAGLYLRKAGTLILGVSVVLWALTSFPRMRDDAGGELSAEERQALELSHTVAGRIGHAMEPVIRPLGFDWRIGTAMIGAFAAKEVFVAQLGIVFAIGEADDTSEPLRTKLSEHYSPLVGFCIMLFMLISAPCMATIAVTRRESHSWKWALFQLASLTLLAYGLTFLVYQAGRALGLGAGL